ncbi:MAG: helix-turn-helix domain-containing protein [Candidatus Pacebacteria bacterium]|nr:helix-turn-helix domain-containing protein [Candidatus Paceibacterota bacterium]
MSDDSRNERKTPRAQQQNLPLQWSDEGAADPESKQPPNIRAHHHAGAENSTARAKNTRPAYSESSALPDDTIEHRVSQKRVRDESSKASEEVVEPDPPQDSVAKTHDDREKEREEGADGALTEASEPEAAITRLGTVDMSLGQTLMEARGAKNLSIAQVSQTTRIPKDFIEQIEADRIESLPPPVYTRSYIAQLCREYDLPSETVLEKYNTVAAGHNVTRPRRERFVLGTEDEDSMTIQYQPRISREVVSGKMLQKLSRGAVIGALLLLVVLVLAAVIVQQYKNYRMRQEENTLTPTAETQQAPIDMGEFIVPQQLPLVELPVPDNTD